MSPRILVYGMTPNAGGKETYVMSAFFALSPHVEFVFISDSPRIAYEDELVARGALVQRVRPRSAAPLGHYQDLKRILQDGRFDAVWCHHSVLNSLAVVRFAKRNGVPVRALHSHSTQNMGTRVAGTLHPINRRLAPRVANRFFACSQPAGDWLFGSHPFIVLPNSFDVDRFTFDETVRANFRRTLGLSDQTLVIAHVARFGAEKNHAFVVDILSEMRSEGSNAVVLFVGEGTLMADVKRLVAERGLSPYAHFLGQRRDVPEVLQAADVAVLPSHFEGLPYALLEAQAAGLSCVASDAVDPGADVDGNVLFLSLNAPLSLWLSSIRLAAQRRRVAGVQPLRGSPYDMATSRERLLDALGLSDAVSSSSGGQFESA